MIELQNHSFNVWDRPKLEICHISANMERVLNGERDRERRSMKNLAAHLIDLKGK